MSGIKVTTLRSGELPRIETSAAPKRTDAALHQSLSTGVDALLFGDGARARVSRLAVEEESKAFMDDAERLLPVTAVDELLTELVTEGSEDLCPRCGRPRKLRSDLQSPSLVIQVTGQAAWCLACRREMAGIEEDEAEASVGMDGTSSMIDDSP
jgi:hypothetical protein